MRKYAVSCDPHVTLMLISREKHEINHRPGLHKVRGEICSITIVIIVLSKSLSSGLKWVSIINWVSNIRLHEVTSNYIKFISVYYQPLF